MNDIRIDTIKLEYATALEQLQIDCFPTLAAHERLRREHFLRHCELFPEGNFVAIAGDQVVGLGSGFLTDFDFDDPDHTFQEIIAGGFYTNHNPDGLWYYGGDISVHPGFRRRGIGSKLYARRKAVVKRLNRRGIVGGGLLPGFAAYKQSMSPKEYVAQVIKGELYDSTLSFQLRQGFMVRGLLQNYIEDSASDNWSVLIVWENPDFQP